MTRFPSRLQEKLARQEARNAFRQLPEDKDLVDFSSNDYLGFSKNREIFVRASQWLSEKTMIQNGATGSRLLSGNHLMYVELEKKLVEFHQTGAALVFNSGYDANIGFFGAVPQRGDIVFYDEYIHASIRDGIKMGNAKSYKFKHNDFEDLKVAVELSSKATLGGTTDIYIVTESVFSMDGDSPDLKTFAKFCQDNGYHLIVDEAHALGVFGSKGEGIIQELGLQDAVFARIVTFGKAMGCHGAAILGSIPLKNYLINFARSLMYTTGLPPHSVATILASYEYLSKSDNEGDQMKKHGQVQTLADKIAYFNLELEALNFGLSEKRPTSIFIPSSSAIHCCILPGNEKVKKIAGKIKDKGFDVRPIISPTVPEGQERLRICLHAFNTEKEMTEVLQLLAIFTNET